MKANNILIFLSLLIITESVLISNNNKTALAIVPTEIDIPEIENIPIPVAEIIKDIMYPKPSYTPVLRPYEINKNYDIWHAKNPSSYITPDNEWVKYYASQLFIDVDGRIKYKNEKVVSLVNTNGDILLYANKPFINNYVYDWEQFGSGSRGSLANDDYWINADYYLTHNMKGDCEDWAIVVASMMLSGEMSIFEKYTTYDQEDNAIIITTTSEFRKLIIPSKVVMGYIDGVRDGWVEYNVYDKNWITTTSRQKDYDGIYHSSTIFIEKDNQFKSVFEFTDKYFRRV